MNYYDKYLKYKKKYNILKGGMESVDPELARILRQRRQWQSTEPTPPAVRPTPPTVRPTPPAVRPTPPTYASAWYKSGAREFVPQAVTATPEPATPTPELAGSKQEIEPVPNPKSQYYFVKNQSIFIMYEIPGIYANKPLEIKNKDDPHVLNAKAVVERKELLLSETVRQDSTYDFNWKNKRNNIHLTLISINLNWDNPINLKIWQTDIEKTKRIIKFGLSYIDGMKLKHEERNFEILGRFYGKKYTPNEEGQQQIKLFWNHIIENIYGQYIKDLKKTTKNGIIYYEFLDGEKYPLFSIPYYYYEPEEYKPHLSIVPIEGSTVYTIKNGNNRLFEQIIQSSTPLSVIHTDISNKLDKKVFIHGDIYDGRNRKKVMPFQDLTLNISNTISLSTTYGYGKINLT
jgi:hypothetical protein